MNFMNELVRHLSILRGEARSERLCFITAPVEDLSDLARTVMKGHGLVGDIQDSDRYHITLGVYPDFPESAIENFLQISLPIKFSVSAARLGTFETAPSKPLVLLVDPDPALVRLQSDIYNLGLKMGLQQSDPDHFKASLWQPHITLALNVEELPDSFNMIKPVKVGVDRFVLQRNGYDEIVEVHLPGSVGDRLLVTVRSVVQRDVQPEIVERITPETGIEVSHEDFMALMRGENVVHGATRRVLKFEDGPFVVVRHGVHIGQEGRPGSRGGSQPGYRHLQGGQGYRKIHSPGPMDQDAWHRAITGQRAVTIVTVEGVEGTMARLMTWNPDTNQWMRTEVHDFPTPEEAIALGNKWLAGAEEEIAAEQEEEREADDEAAEEYATGEEEYEYGTEPDEFGEVEEIEAEDIYQPGGDEAVAEVVEPTTEVERPTFAEWFDENQDWTFSEEGRYFREGELEGGRGNATVIVQEHDYGAYEVDYEVEENGTITVAGSRHFTTYEEAARFTEAFMATGEGRTAVEAMDNIVLPTIAGYTPQPIGFGNIMSQREGWGATHPDRPNVYRHEDPEAGRLAEILPSETFAGEERFRVGYSEYGEDVETRLSADGFRDFDNLEDALTFSERYVETGSTVLQGRMTGLMEDTGVSIEDAAPEGWTQNRGASFGRTSMVGDNLIEVEVLEKAAFPEDFRDLGLVDSGYHVSVLNADAETGDTNESRSKHFDDARQAFIYAESYLQSGDARQAAFETGLGSGMTREFRQDMQFLPEWMDSLTENQLVDGEWQVQNSGADVQYGRTGISRDNPDTNRSVRMSVANLTDPGQEDASYEVVVEYRDGSQIKVFSTTPDRMVETLRTMEQYVEGGPPGGNVYEGVSWRPAGPNTWIANPSERATNEGEATWDDRDVMDFAQLRTNPDGSVNLQLHAQDAADPVVNSAYTQNATAFGDASRWLAGGQYLHTEVITVDTPIEPFEGARTFPSSITPPLDAGLREPATTREPTVDPETGAGTGLDMNRIIDDIRNSRLTIETNSENVDEWNDFQKSVGVDRDWEGNAQNYAGSILDDAEFGGEFDEDFNPSEYLEYGQYLEEYDMEQAQERWDENFMDNAWPEASQEIMDRAHNRFNLEVDQEMDESIGGRSMVDLPAILNLSEDEVSALSTDEIERRLYNNAVGEVAAEWGIVTDADWNELTWERRQQEGSQMALANEGAFANENDRLRWSELSNEALDNTIYEAFIDDDELNNEINERATTLMGSQRPTSMDVVSYDELREQVFGSGGGGDLQYTLDRLQGNDRRIMFGVDGGEVVTAASISERNTNSLSIPQDVLDRSGISREEVEGDYLFVEYLASKRSRQGYGTELLLNLMKTASEEGKGIVGNSVRGASEFYDHLGAIWVNERGADEGGMAFVTPSAVQRLQGFMMALVAQVEAEEAGIERAEPNLLELLIAAEAKGGAEMTKPTMAQTSADRTNANRAQVNAKLASFTGREIVERARPSTKKPKAFYAPKEEREYPEYFEGQERVSHGSYGTQVFTPYLLGHVDTWEGSRQGAALQAYHRVVGAQKAQDKEIHGFALAHGGRFVGVGSLNFSPDEKPDEKDWISVETLAISEDGHSEAAMEKIIGEASKYNRGVFLYGGDGAEEFLTAIGMRKGENGQYHYTHEDVKQLASELKGPTPDRYIAPTAKPKLRPRFGRLFEESEVKAPVNNEAAPQSREQKTWQARDKWERFNWEAWKDPELVWNPENQMAMGMEEQNQELFQEEVDEEREKGKSDLLNKIKESGTNSISFSHLAKAAAELYGGNARKGHQFLKEAREYEMEYGTEAVWPGGKIKPHDPAHYERLGEFAGEIEGVKGDDSEGSWLDAAEFIYTRTQEAFEISEFEEGDKIRLYRGIPAGHLPEANDGGWVDLDLNALSSWTFNRSTAAHVATQSGEGVLLRTDIPISRVFSMWATGPGSRESMEYLILGQDGTKAWATKINRK